MQVEIKRLHGKTFKPGYNFDPGLKRLPCNHALDLNIDAMMHGTLIKPLLC
jgi:hypothetical protein